MVSGDVKRGGKNKVDAMREGESGSWDLQLMPWAVGVETGAAVHLATTLSTYIMSQVQYSRGWLFKEHKSEHADKKAINIVAEAQHESFG